MLPHAWLGTDRSAARAGTESFRAVRRPSSKYSALQSLRVGGSRGRPSSERTHATHRSTQFGPINASSACSWQTSVRSTALHAGDRQETSGLPKGGTKTHGHEGSEEGKKCPCVGRAGTLSIGDASSELGSRLISSVRNHPYQLFKQSLMYRHRCPLAFQTKDHKNSFFSEVF